MSGREHHPIVEVIAAVLEDGPGGTPTISAAGIEKVRIAIDTYVEAGPALMGAVDQVLTAAHLLEVEKDAEPAAVALVELVDRPAVIDALIAINEAKESERSDAVAKQADEFARFTASEPTKPDPEAEDGADEGAVKLDAFHFPKRL